MGQHLQLYASDTLTPEEAKLWGYFRAYEYSEVPHGEPARIVDKVSKFMNAARDSKVDHLDHWSCWIGPHVWGFLVWDGFLCDQPLVDKAISAAKETMANHTHFRETYPDRDLTKDAAIVFLRLNIGRTVWGDNSGI